MGNSTSLGPLDKLNGAPVLAETALFETVAKTVTTLKQF
jgi:hypothetical protein